MSLRRGFLVYIWPSEFPDTSVSSDFEEFSQDIRYLLPSKFIYVIVNFELRSKRTIMNYEYHDISSVAYKYCWGTNFTDMIPESS